MNTAMNAMDRVDDMDRAPRTAARRSPGPSAWAGWLGGVVAVTIVALATLGRPGWVVMWAVAATEFYVLKLATLAGSSATLASPARVAGYLFAWPGMNARAFLASAPPVVSSATRVTAAELVFAVAKLHLGLVLALWATVHAVDAPPLAVGWVGMLGIIFTLHFGAFHVASWLWRAAGVTAPPLMRAPIAATSLAEFWGERWNIAFAEGARRFVLRPLARRLGMRGAGFAVFVVSGLIHETVISLPARGGWGGPTLYFFLHGVGLALEKSAWGVRIGLGRGLRGRAWTHLFALGPLPLLFHGPFVHHVIVPLFRDLAAFLP